MADSEEMSDRRAAILRAVIQSYVATARPVGSATVGDESAMSVSSATIRKELGALEDAGYLDQPHTSAGRVPTEKGYRYFVDLLMKPGKVDKPQSQRVEEFFTQTHGELERMLRQTSELLHNLTHYAAVVVAPEPDSATVRSVQLVDLSPHVVLAVAVLSSGAVERCTVELSPDQEPTPQDLADANTALAAAMVGEAYGAAREAASSNPVALAIASLVSREFSEQDERMRRLYVGGASSVADVFEATETVGQVLSLLERQLLVSSLIRNVLDRGMRVAIGTETGMEPLSECSIVVAPYLIEGEEVGSVGVLGPQRMNYAQALATVAIVSDGLSAHLSER